MARTIASPGVEIKEFDQSTYTATPVGTTILLMGYADKGPTDEIIELSDFEEFKEIYGQPTNAAERYFYHSANQLCSTNTNVYCARLPYGLERGEGFGNKYGALAYPVVSAFNFKQLSSVSTSSLKSLNVTSTLDDVRKILKDNETKSADIQKITSLNDLSNADYIVFGEPKHVDLTKAEYLSASNSLKWSKDVSSIQKLNDYGLIILNYSQTTINDQYEGYYIGITDNEKLEPGSAYNSILNVKSVNQSFALSNITTSKYIDLPETRLDFELSAVSNSNINSVSEVLENIPSFNVFGPQFIDSTALGLFKLRKTVFSTDVIKLDYSLQEAYFGSFDYWRKMQSQNGGPAKRVYMSNLVDNDSTNIKIVINDYISNKNTKSWLDINGNPTKAIKFDDTAKALFAVSSYSPTTANTKQIGELPAKIDRIFSKLEDTELFDLDGVCEAGLGTIWVNTLIGDNRIVPGVDEIKTLPAGSSNVFDDTLDITSWVNNNGAGGSFYNTGLTELKGSANTIKTAYETIANKLSTFASKTRKDHIFFLDPLRFTCVQGANTKILNATDSNGEAYNFSQHVYWPMRYQFMAQNTSYGVAYANWGKVYDESSDSYIWIPCSATMAAVMAYSSDVSYPWYAPAGFNRGVVTTLDEVALYPNQKQRDQLYKISLNPIAYFPNDGIVVWGQKTLQSKPSAFDRLNVRRLFLYLEKATKTALKYFVFEPNTYFTRTQVFNTLDPIFNRVKNQQGMYDYRLICNESNNTASVIDNNEMMVDIYIAPTKAAEYILANFYATRTNGAVITTEQS